MLGVKRDYGIQNIIQKDRDLKNTHPNDPNYLTKLVYPALWTSGLHLDQCIDMPMHQLFECVVKTLIEQVAIWLKGLGLYTKFG